MQSDPFSLGGYNQDDIETVFYACGGTIGEVANLTREVIVPRDGAGPLLLLPSGLPTIPRNRAIAAALFTCLIQRADRASVIAALRELFGCASQPPRFVPSSVASIRRWWQDAS